MTRLNLPWRAFGGWFQRLGPRDKVRGRLDSFILFLPHLAGRHLPSFALAHAEDPTAGNPLRVNGGGEGGIVPSSAALVNALCDALAEKSVDDCPMPATRGAVWGFLNGRMG